MSDDALHRLAIKRTLEIAKLEEENTRLRTAGDDLAAAARQWLDAGVFVNARVRSEIRDRMWTAVEAWRSGRGDAPREG